MKKNRITKKILSVSLASLLAGFAGSASASGFQLFYYNGASVGDVGAGAAATADDASIGFTNAAGLVRMKRPQIVVSGAQVLNRAKFTGTVTPGGTGTTVSNGSSLIPAFHYASPINDKLFFGFGITAPFGSSTDFPATGIQRFSATSSDIKTVNISPSIAYKINEKFSVGAGIDIQRMEAKLNQIVPIGGGASVNNDATGWGYGFHVGATYQFTPATRIGLHYRSQVAHRLTGSSLLTSATGSTISNSTNLGANLRLPPTTTFSIHHDVTSKWALMGTANYTQWSTIQNITLTGLASPLPNTVLPMNFRNTWRVSVGTAYTINDKWLVRAGVGYDQTPTTNGSRILRLPDNDRWLVGIGARYRVTKNLAIDAGWTRAFIKDAPINIAASSSPFVAGVNGTVKNTADVIGLQFTYDFM